MLFPDEGGELGYTMLGYTTLEDITVRKNLELAAHDLKAPVHNIKMIMDMLRRHAGAPHQPGGLAGQAPGRISPLGAG